LAARAFFGNLAANVGIFFVASKFRNQTGIEPETSQRSGGIAPDSRKFGDTAAVKFKDTPGGEKTSSS